MSYVRIKWIKGHPYLYEQASYRVGKQVKTQHIRYIGKYGYRGSGSVGARPGFQPPEGLTPERRAYVDRYIAQLKQSHSHPYECEILRQVLYHHKFEVSALRSEKSLGQVWRNQGGEVTKFRLRKDSRAFTWMHELGHALEFADHLLDDELTKLRMEYKHELYRAFWKAYAGDLEEKAAFMQRFGKLINLRQSLETWTPNAKLEENRFIYKQLERVRAWEIPAFAFHTIFRAWLMMDYRLKREEILADSVASLIINPKYAFEAHGQEGRQYLSKLYIKLYQHLESKYQISLGRPRQEQPEQKDNAPVVLA